MVEGTNSMNRRIWAGIASLGIVLLTGCNTDRSNKSERTSRRRATPLSARQAIEISRARETLRIREAQFGSEDPRTLAAVNELATVYEAAEQFSGAQPLREQALNTTQKLHGGEDVYTATNLNNLAALYLLMGRYQTAEPLFERALRIRQRLQTNSEPVAEVMNNLGVLFTMMGAHSRAAPFYQQALEIYEKKQGPEAPGTMSVLDNLANLYQLEGSYTNAEPLFLRILRVREKSSKPESADTAVVLDNLGCLYISMGQPARAQPLLERALEIDKKQLGVDATATAGVMNDLGETYTAIGSLTNAEPILWQALASAEQHASPSLKNRVQYNLRVLLAKQGRREEAIFFGKQAVNTLQSMRGKQLSMDKELQNSFVGIHGDYYRGLAGLLIEAGRLGEAHQVLRMLKEEEYFEFIERDAGQANALTNHIGLNQRELAWQSNYVAVSTNGMMNSRRDGTNHVSEVITGYKLEHLFDQIYAESKTNNHPVSENLYDISAMQGDLSELGPGTVLLHYVMAPERLYIILTTKDKQMARWYDIPEESLNRLVSDLKGALSSPGENPLPAAQKLYQVALAPIAKLLEEAKATTVMVCLDGSLRYIPFSALHDGSKYVVQKYRTEVFTEMSKTKLKDQPRGDWHVAGLGLSEKVGIFPPLAYVKEELTAIVKSDESSEGILPGIIRLNKDFTRQELETCLSGGYQVMHIASHFYCNAGTISESYLLLWGNDHLTLLDLKTNDTVRFDRVDLLTLSACETGMSEIRAGSGGELEGFATVTQRKGAKAILATLWPALDMSTCDFMKNFYRQHLGRARITKAEALQKAQLAFLEGTAGTQVELAGNYTRGVNLRNIAGTSKSFQRDPNAPFAHPYYWAPFVLIGNWR
jgi:CHAT domain-containing protein/Flp pilus assembly protein TadD